MRIAMITNINSGKNKCNKSIYFLSSQFRDKFKQNFKHFYTGNKNSIKNILNKIKRDNTNLLIINGGDGTIQGIITEMIKIYPENEYPYIFILSNGTMNIVAKNLGKIKTYKKLLDKILKWQPDKDIKIINCLKITDLDKNAVNYGFIFANGLIYKMLNKYERKRGFFNGLLCFLRTYLFTIIRPNKIRSHYANIILNNKVLRNKNYYFTVVSSLQKLLFNISPCIKRKNPYVFLGKAKNSIRNLTLKYLLNLRKGIHSEELGKIIITTNSGYTVDGELFELGTESTLMIEKGPEIRFVTI